jgi:hypothetical protein
LPWRFYIKDNKFVSKKWKKDMTWQLWGLWNEIIKLKLFPLIIRTKGF